MKSLKNFLIQLFPVLDSRTGFLVFLVTKMKGEKAFSVSLFLSTLLFPYAITKETNNTYVFRKPIDITTQLILLISKFLIQRSLFSCKSKPVAPKVLEHSSGEYPDQGVTCVDNLWNQQE